MKKAKKILLTVLPVMMLVLVVFVTFGSNVLATGVSTEFPAGNTGSSTVDTIAKNAWGTVLSVLQILAFAAVVIAGVRYMFASADQKADIKKGMIYLIIGAILVFASSTIIKVVVNATNEVAPTTSGMAIVETIEKV